MSFAFAKRLAVMPALLFLTGCSMWSIAALNAAAAANEPVVELRWAGWNHVQPATRGMEIEAISQLPETDRVIDQLFRKSAIALLGLSVKADATNDVEWFQILLRELATHPSVLRLYRDTHGWTCALVAVHSPQTNAIWESTLRRFARELVGSSATSAPASTNRGWIFGELATLKSDVLKSRLSFAGLKRTNDWYVFGIASSNERFEQSAVDVSRVLTASNLSNNWLAVSADLDTLSPLLGKLSSFLVSTPRVQARFYPENKKVGTEAVLTFPQNLDLVLSPWQVPTNLIETPSASFSAIRGLNQLISREFIRDGIGADSLPDQLFVWALVGQPRLTFAAANMPNASLFVNHVAEKAMPGGKAWLNAEGTAGFRKSVDHNGFEWQGMPYVWPFLRWIETNGVSQLLAGTFAYAPVLEQMGSKFYESAIKGEDLMYYGWEQTGFRLEHWLFLGQFARFVSGKAQLPNHAVTLPWLKVLQPVVGESTTRATVLSANRLKISRSSTCGLTAIEIHLLCDMLESPTFPFGFHTFAAQVQISE